MKDGSTVLSVFVYCEHSSRMHIMYVQCTLDIVGSRYKEEFFWLS